MIYDDIVESHCPYCKKITRCELYVQDSMSSVLRCTECGRSWREEVELD